MTVGVGDALAGIMAPLAPALESRSSLALLLGDLGWEIELTDEQAAVVSDLLPITGAVETLAAGPSAAEAAAAAGEIWQAIEGLSGVTAARLAALPAPLDAPETWADLALALPEYLVLRWLQLDAPLVFGLAHVAGVIADGADGRAAWDWDALGSLLRDPVARMAEVYGWGAALDHERVLDELAGLAAGAGLRPRSTPGALDIELHRGFTADRGTLLRLGVLVTPADDDGLLVTNELLGDAAGALDLGNGWTAAFEAGADLSGALGVVLRPGSARLAGDDARPGAAMRLAFAPEQPWAFGAPGGLRIELDGIDAGLSLLGTASEPELVLDARLAGLVVSFDPARGDAFLADVLGAEALSASVETALTWSSRHGFGLEAGAGFAVEIPMGLHVGPLALSRVRLALAADGTGALLDAALTGGLALGPFAATLDGIGVRARAAAAEGTSGTLGPLAAALELLPPQGIGFAAGIPGVLSAGGAVDHDPETGRYTGALELQVLAVDLSAVVVLDTRLPGQPDGWALFASVSATFPRLPLGFGFFLSGVGGIVCLNRTLDGEALATGLRDGAVDAILFPDDPLADAAVIASGLDSWFPIAPGSTVFGVAATITWGVPVLITAEVGVALAFPDLELVVLGSVSLALPDEDTALLDLHMDTLGVIDPAAGTVTVTASLYDSTLLRTIQLSGDMAMYGSFARDPYFLLSVGGYHPGFDPPGFLPAAVVDLRRTRFELALGDDVWFALESYVAITSDSLQFGASASFEASAGFLGVTYAATGRLGFNVLFLRDPFSFTASAGVSVSVTAGGAHLIVAELHVRLTGPEPWSVWAHGRFEFLHIGVRFEISFGGAAAAVAAAPVDVGALVRAALEDPLAWQAAGAGGAVVFAEEGVSPDARLEVRQSAAPLDRAMAVYGIYPVAGAATLALDGAGIDGADATWSAATGWFAPGQYDVLSTAEKLSAPSYELMTAGASIGVDGVATGTLDQSVVPDYEVAVIDEETTRDLGVGTLVGAFAAVTLSGRGPRTVTSPSFDVGPTAWTRIDPETGLALGRPGTYAEIVAHGAPMAPAHAAGARA